MSGSLKNRRPNEMRLKLLERKVGFKSDIVYNFERINPKTGERESDLPTLNFDSDPWIPGILASHERIINETDPKLFENNFYEKLYKEDEEELEQLILPRPQKKSTFCGVCERLYEDYYTHVNSEEHQKNFKNNPHLEQIIEEAEMIQAEFQDYLLTEVNMEEISSKETFAPVASDPKSEKEPNESQKEIRYNRSANKENDEPETTGDKKTNRIVRRLNHMFNEDPTKETTLSNAERQNPVMGRKIQVQKVFNIPTANQRVLSGEKYHPGFEEKNKVNNENNSLHNWMFYPQDNMKNSQKDGLGASRDVERRESRSKDSTKDLKRKYSTFAEAESDQEVLNRLKKVKITDDNSNQEDQKMVQLPVNFVKGTFNYLMNTFSERLGNLKSRLFNQFGINK